MNITTIYPRVSTRRRNRKKKEVAKLYAFVDHQGLLRIGGRLPHADVAEDHRHPTDYQVTQLIIREAHMHTLCGSVTAVHNILRMRYWVLNDQKIIMCL